jgi:hypothetical protein
MWMLMLVLVLVLVRLSRWIGGAVVVHRPVLRGSPTRWSSHSLPLLGFLVDVDCIIRDNDVIDEL